MEGKATSQTLFSLEGRTVLVTGGNGGLGQAMALAFRAAGARVAVTGRNPEKNERIGEALGAGGAVFVLDVRDEEAVQRTVAGVVERFGRLDLLVNNAGYARAGAVTDRTRGLVDRPLGDQIRRKTPAGRWGRPEDLAGTALFLASAASDFVTGVCIPVDGGYAVAERFLQA